MFCIYYKQISIIRLYDLNNVLNYGCRYVIHNFKQIIFIVTAIKNQTSLFSQLRLVPSGGSLYSFARGMALLHIRRTYKWLIWGKGAPSEVTLIWDTV